MQMWSAKFKAGPGADERSQDPKSMKAANKSKPTDKQSDRGAGLDRCRHLL